MLAAQNALDPQYNLLHGSSVNIGAVNANSVWPGFTGTDFSSGYSSCSWEKVDKVDSL